MPSTEDFCKNSEYNFETKSQLWGEVIQNSHDQFCGCHKPYAHLLAQIFPPGHRDRHLTIQQIIERDITTCHSGGEEEIGGGEAGAVHITEEENIQLKLEEDTIEENLEEALAAATAAEKR